MAPAPLLDAALPAPLLPALAALPVETLEEDGRLVGAGKGVVLDEARRMPVPEGGAAAVLGVEDEASALCDGRRGPGPRSVVAEPALEGMLTVVALAEVGIMEDLGLETEGILSSLRFLSRRPSERDAAEPLSSPALEPESESEP
jgi:hypothetical protein